MLMSFQRNRATRDRFRRHYACTRFRLYCFLHRGSRSYARMETVRKRIRVRISGKAVFATLFTQDLYTSAFLQVLITSRKTSQLTTQREPSRSSLSFITTSIVVNPSFASWSSTLVCFNLASKATRLYIRKMM